jgi:hypothetical protein
VLDKGPTRMDALQIGDAVLTTSGIFSTVYSFGHYDPRTVSSFIQLWTEASSSPLEITGDHLLFVQEGHRNLKILPACEIKVGDLLVAPKELQGESDGVKVTAITMVHREGLYSPFTTTGSMAVNGVVASNYIALSPVFQDVMSYEQQHWLQHLAYMPYRFYCGMSGCNVETYDEVTGLSGAVMMWLPLLHFVEAIFPWMAHIVASAVAYIAWKKHAQLQVRIRTVKY